MMVLTPNMLTLNYFIDDNTTEMRVLPLTKIHAYQRSRYCQFLIAENRDKGKFLAIDGRIQTTESEYMDYHGKMLVNVPHRLDGKPGKALVLGAGEGVTGALLSQYGYEVDAVDIDGVLQKAIQEHLSDWIRPIKTPNKIVTYIYDAFDFLEYVHDKELKYGYDVVVFDLNEPNVASEDCYSADLIKKVKSVLNPGGLFVYQNGSIYDQNPIMDEIIGDEAETKKESVSKIAEWKFSTITFKEENSGNTKEENNEESSNEESGQESDEKSSEESC